MTDKTAKKSSQKNHKKQTRYLSQAIQLEESVNPHIIRATMAMISLALFAFIAWSSLTNINEVARTSGEVVPHGYEQTVQHLEGGIVKAINVVEGDVVQEGQTLITMDDASIKKDLERVQAKQLNLAMQDERLRAYTQKRTPDFSRFTHVPQAMIADQNNFFNGMQSARDKEESVIREQISGHKQSIRARRAELNTAQADLKIAQNLYTKRQRLNARGYASDMQLLDDERALNRAKGEIKRINNQILMAKSQINEYQDRLKSLSARHHDEALERLSSVTADMAQNIEIIQKLQERIGRLHVRATTHGLVKGLSVNTIGAVIQPGQKIMEIMPLDKQLEVSVKISPQDIGHLKIGQPVQVKFSTFDFSRYGSVHGKLAQISAATFSGDAGDRYYQGRVLLDQGHVGHNIANKIMPGMTVMADIITGEKTILQYMLKPIHVSLRTAFTER